MLRHYENLASTFLNTAVDDVLEHRKNAVWDGVYPRPRTA
jgi:hypothetical protein